MIRNSETSQKMFCVEQIKLGLRKTEAEWGRLGEAPHLNDLV